LLTKQGTLNSVALHDFTLQAAGGPSSSRSGNVALASCRWPGWPHVLVGCYSHPLPRAPARRDMHSLSVSSFIGLLT
jgi:hypothetical protein